MCNCGITITGWDGFWTSFYFWLAWWLIGWVVMIIHIFVWSESDKEFNEAVDWHLQNPHHTFLVMPMIWPAGVYFIIDILRKRMTSDG